MRKGLILLALALLVLLSVACDGGDDVAVYMVTPNTNRPYEEGDVIELIMDGKPLPTAEQGETDE